jgi:hypothetical protein
VDDPLTSVAALHALTYCERLFYLEEVERIRVADAAVFAGRRLHVELAKDDAEGTWDKVTLESTALGICGVPPARTRAFRVAARGRKLSCMTGTQSKWVERVREWMASGRSASDYAEGKGFAASTLVWWSSRIRNGTLGSEAASAASGSQVRMARVVRGARPSSSLTLRVAGALIEVRTGFDGRLLREVVEALGDAR